MRKGDAKRGSVYDAEASLLLGYNSGVSFLFFGLILRLPLFYFILFSIFFALSRHKSAGWAGQPKLKGKELDIGYLFPCLRESLRNF